jgi:hypothetical protein
VQGIDGGDSGRNARTLDVDVALGGQLVHVDVQYPAVKITLLYDIIAHVTLPAGRGLAVNQCTKITITNFSRYAILLLRRVENKQKKIKNTPAIC